MLLCLYQVYRTQPGNICGWRHFISSLNDCARAQTGEWKRGGEGGHSICGLSQKTAGPVKSKRGALTPQNFSFIPRNALDYPFRVQGCARGGAALAQTRRDLRLGPADAGGHGYGASRTRPPPQHRTRLPRLKPGGRGVEDRGQGRRRSGRGD